MNVETILRDKGDWVATIRPDATIADAVDMLNRERIGALVVSDDGGGDVVGMLSERDIVIALGRHGEELLSRPVEEIMTRNVVTCEPGDTVGQLGVRGRPVAEDQRHPVRRDQRPPRGPGTQACVAHG